MISEKDKQQIDAKLKRANIDNLTVETSGKIKRLAELLYNDDREKKKYMIMEIARRNTNVAMEIAKNLAHNEEIIELIMELSQRNLDDTKEERLINIINFFHQGKELEFIKGLGKIMGELTFKERKLIYSLFRRYGELLNLFEECLYNGVIDDQFFTYIVQENNFNYGDILESQKKTISVFTTLLKEKCYNSCAVLIKKISIHKFYRLFPISYCDFNEIMNNQTVFRSTDRLELGYCRVSFKHDFDSYQLYRDKYRDQIAKKVYWFYLSLLYEYLRTKTFREKHLEYFRELEKYQMSMEELEHGELFSAIAYVIQECIHSNGDVAELLAVLKRINISRADYEERIHVGKYDKGVLLEEAGIKLLTEYQDAGHSVEEMLSLYFNSYLKYAVHINKFLTRCVCDETSTRVLESWLQNTIFRGKIRYKEPQVLLITPFHFRTNSIMAYPVSKQKMNQFSVDDIVTFRLIWREWHVEIVEIKIMEEEESLDVTVEKALDSMRNMCEEANGYLKIYAYMSKLRWNKTYQVNLENVYYDFSFFGGHSKEVLGILESLLKQEGQIENVVKLYMNSFFKLALSLNEFHNLLVKYCSEKDVNAVLSSYHLVIKLYSKKEKRYLPEQVKTTGCRMEESSDEIQYFEGKFIARFQNKEDGILVFKYDKRATYDIVIKKGINGMLRAFQGFLENEYQSKEQYQRIKRVPLEYYNENIELKNKIAKIIRQTMMRKAHNLYGLCDYIKSLSLHNVYCSRLDIDKKWQDINKYMYDKELVAEAERLTEVLARNSDSLSRCFFVYINSFLKQYMLAETFYRKCLLINPLLYCDSFSYKVAVLGNIVEWGNRSYACQITSMGCDTVLPIEAVETAEKINMLMELAYENNQVTFRIKGEP